MMTEETMGTDVVGVLMVYLFMTQGLCFLFPVYCRDTEENEEFRGNIYQIQENNKLPGVFLSVYVSLIKDESVTKTKQVSMMLYQ